MDPTDELSKVPQSTKIKSVICAMIVNLMIGSYYFFSNINTYVASYLRSFDPTVTSKDTLLIMPIWIVMQSAGTIISISLTAKYGYVKISNVSYSIFALANLIMVFVKSYWGFVIIYGGLTGLCIGIGYMPALFIAWTYYPDKKSIVTGVSLFTAGISASILSPISTAIVNPKNVMDYENDPEVYNRVPFLFFCLFAYFGGLILVGAIMQPPPFESKIVQELVELEELEAAQKEELAKDGMVEMEVVGGSGSRKNSEKGNNPAQEGTVVNDYAASHTLNKDSFRKVIEKEVMEDKNILPNYTAGLSSVQLASLVINKPSVRVMINDRKESIRQSIRQSINRASIPQTLGRLKPGNHLQHYSLKEGPEKHAIGLLKTPEVDPKTLVEDQKVRESINLYIKQVHLDCPSLKYALLSWPYLSLALMAYSCSIYNYFMNSVWKQFYVTKIEVSDAQMALILSYGAFANSIVRVVSGFAMMKYDFKYIYLLLVGSTILCCFTIDAFLVNYFVGALYSMTVFGGIGIQVTIFPTVCTKVFGQSIGSKVFPFVFSFFSMANLTQYFILKFTDHWGFMFVLFGIIACGGFGLGLFFTSSPDWREAQSQYQAAKLREDEESAALKTSLLHNKH